jgi:hypothetical protein
MTIRARSSGGIKAEQFSWRRGLTFSKGNCRAMAPRTTVMSYNLLIELLDVFVTQMFTPSKAIPRGLIPTENVPNMEPLLARSFVTLLLV